MKRITLLLGIVFLSGLSAQELGVLYESKGNIMLTRANKQFVELEPSFVFENYDYIEVSDMVALRLPGEGTAEFSTGSRFVLQYGSYSEPVPRTVLLAGSLHLQGKAAMELGLYDSILSFSNAELRVGIGIRAIVVQVINGNIQYAKDDRVRELAAGSGLFLPVDTDLIPELIVFDDYATAKEGFDAWMQEASYTPDALTKVVEHYAAANRHFDMALYEFAADEYMLYHMLNTMQRNVLPEHVADFREVAEKLNEREEELVATMYRFEYLAEVLYQWYKISSGDIHTKDARILSNIVLAEALQAYPSNKDQFNTLRAILVAGHQVQKEIMR